jgi:hypothetical protein
MLGLWLLLGCGGKLMGIFTRKRPSMASPANPVWRADSTGVKVERWIEGDIQVGEAWSVRFICDEKPCSRITVSFYATRHAENPGEFDVQRQVEWMVCQTPALRGATAIWSDVSYDDISEVVIDSAAEAEQEARAWADQVLLQAADYGGWDGEPDWGRS